MNAYQYCELLSDKILSIPSDKLGKVSNFPFVTSTSSACIVFIAFIRSDFFGIHLEFLTRTSDLSFDITKFHICIIFDTGHVVMLKMDILSGL